MITTIKDKLRKNARLSLLIPFITIASIFIITPLIFLLVKIGENPAASKDMFTRQSTWLVVWRSVYLGFFAAVISLLLIGPFTYIVARSQSKSFKVLALGLIVSPLVVFTIAKVFALKGLLTKMFDDPEALKQNWVLVIGMVYLFSPFMVIPLYSVFSSMPKSLLEAAEDLGDNKIKVLIKVVIPYSLKAIFAGVAMVFMLSATNIVLSHSLLPEHSNLPLVGNLIDQNAVRMRQDAQAGAWGSTLSLITIFVMISVYAAIYFAPLVIRKLKGGVNV